MFAGRQQKIYDFLSDFGKMMIDYPALIFLIVSACVTLWLAVRMFRRPHSTMQTVLAILCILTVLVNFTLLPRHNRLYEIEQYRQLFTAVRVTCAGEDVTELFHGSEHQDGLVLTQTAPCPLDEVEGTEAGRLEFYSDTGRAFRKIVLVRLAEESSGPRIYQAGGASYVFCSTGAIQEYVFALPESIAVQLISLFE